MENKQYYEDLARHYDPGDVFRWINKRLEDVLE